MSTLDRIVEHLQFVGYETHLKDEGVIRALHPHKWNIILKNFRGGVLINAWLNANQYAKGRRQEYLEFINALNREATVARFYSDNDGDLVMEAFWGAPYDKVSFGAFLDAWDEDTRDNLVRAGGEKYLE